MSATPKTYGGVCPAILRCLMLFAFVIAVMPLATAQQFFGSIVGTVTDTSGAVVPGATATLTNKATGEKRTATSNAAGEYTFVDLVPATYSITIERANFKRQVRDSIIVDVNATVRVNAALQVGAVTETVEVNMGRTVELQTDSGTVSNKVEAAQMDELPLNGRNMMALVNITPGVIPSSPVEQGATMAQNAINGVGTQTNPLSWGGGSSVYTINGGDNEEYLDGAPLNMLQGSNIGLMPTADSIQEFNIDTSAGDSSEGRATGGVINQSAKSGTNRLHWTAYDYFRNADLNANQFINNNTRSSSFPNGVPRPEFNQNQYGFSVGFPVKKDRIFFFGSYEVDNVKSQATLFTMQPSCSGSSNCPGGPTTAVPGGSDIYDGVFNQPIADPLGNCPTVNGTVTGPNTGHNIIADTTHSLYALGQGCMDSTGLVLRSFWAARPNIAAIRNSGGTIIENYAVNEGTGNVAPQMNARMDFVVSPKQRIFAHTAWWAPLDVQPAPYPNNSANYPSGLPGGAPWNLKLTTGGFNTNLYIVGDTYTFNTKTVLDVRAEYIRFRYSMVPGNNNFPISNLGANWAPLATYIPASQRVLPSPNVTTNGGAFSGSSVENGIAPTNIPFGFGTGGQGQIWDNYGVNATLAHVYGKHSVRVGMEARLMDMEVLPNGYSAGNPSFGNNYMCVKGSSGTCTAGTGDEWADLLMGYYNGVTINGSLNGTEYSYYQAYFAQDSWQARRNLTINLGARWELPGGLMEKKNSDFVLLPYAADPFTGALGTEVLTASAAAPSRSIFPIKHGLIDPRVGFAYRLDDKTVIRGGYGVSHQAVDEDGGGNGAAGNALNSQSLADNNPITVSNKVASLPTHVASNPFYNIATATNETTAIYVPRLGRTRADFVQYLAQAKAVSSGAQGLNGFWTNEPLPYYQQYNFAIERQIKNSFKISVAYVGSHAIHLKAPGGAGIDQAPPSSYAISGAGATEAAYPSSGPYSQTGATPTKINQGIPNTGTVAGVTQSSVLCTPGLTGTPANYAGTGTGYCNYGINVGRLLQPYIYYSGVTIGNLAYANQRYNSLQASTQWRIPGGGLIGSAFTWAETIGDNVNAQDNYNRHADRTKDGNNGAPLRLVVNVNYPLPIGQGKMFFNTSNQIVSRVISGWAINDISSFQHGAPLLIGSNNANNIPGVGTSRPSYVPGAPGCNANKQVSGGPVDKFRGGQWFNTNCFVSRYGTNGSSANGGGQNNAALAAYLLGPYDFGNEPAVDRNIFAQGIDNQDISLAKTTKVTERINVVFRMETFNTFNRVQFSAPANLNAGNSAFGAVTGTANNPRWVQLSLRVNY